MITEDQIPLLVPGAVVTHVQWPGVTITLTWVEDGQSLGTGDNQRVYGMAHMTTDERKRMTLISSPASQPPKPEVPVGSRWRNENTESVWEALGDGQARIIYKGQFGGNKRPLGYVGRPRIGLDSYYTRLPDEPAYPVIGVATGCALPGQELEIRVSGTTARTLTWGGGYKFKVYSENYERALDRGEHPKADTPEAIWAAHLAREQEIARGMRDEGKSTHVGDHWLQVPRVCVLDGREPYTSQAWTTSAAIGGMSRSLATESYRKARERERLAALRYPAGNFDD